MSLLIPNNIKTLCVRNIGIARGRKPFVYEGGIKYPGFTYYPRYPDFKDPPYEPTKLFQVQRIKPIKGTPYWERNILKQYNLMGKSSDIAIVKNIPEDNARLWRIKHLIKITPITFPNGFPKDCRGTYLKENGELIVAQKTDGSLTQLQATEAFQKDPKKLDGDTLRRQSRKKWLSGW